MNKTILCVAAAAAATGLATAGDPAQVTESDRVAELSAQVDALHAQVEAMSARDGEEWLTEQRAEEIRGLVQDVLADADTRASLLQSGMTAGYDKKFFIGSADGNFRLEIGGQMQFRYVYNYQKSGSPPGSNSLDQNRWGFENRRAKLKFTGHVFDPSWQYSVTGGFDRDGGTFESEDVFIAKDFDNGWELQAGQFKAPFMREELVSSSSQLAIDRSLVNERFNQDRSEGVQVSYSADRWRLSTMINDGLNSDGSPALEYDTEWASATRAEVLLTGEWSQFKDFTSWRGSEFGAMAGAAIAYQKQEYGTPIPANELEDLRFTVDLSLEGDGWNAFAAFVYQSLDNDASGPASIDTDAYGIVVQGGVFLTDDWEAFARYEYGDPDVSSFSDLSVITVGVNRYFHKHGLKWTTDLGYGLDAAQGAFGDQEGVGWRDDMDGEDGQVVFRSQLQLLF